MSIVIHQISAEEFPVWRKLVRRGFNEHVHPDDIRRLKDERAELDRLLGAYDGDQLVGTGGIDSHTLTVPGGATLPMAGIAYVGTATTHRRRGIFKEMMTELLRQAAERDEPVAGLWPSESGIYGRFGFGQATVSEEWEIERTRALLAHGPTTDADGAVRFIEPHEAMSIMPVVWEEARKNRAGFMDRTPGRWKYNFFDDERVRGGWSGIFYVVYESGNRVTGYAAYRLKELSEDVLDMRVIECVSTSDSAHAALWRFLLNIDLVVSVSVDGQPPDDPLWWILADPRRLKRTPSDGLWLKVLDPAKALSARSYASDGKLVVEVQDSSTSGPSEIFELVVVNGAGECQRVARRPDLVMSAAELGAVYLGGTRLTSLAQAGRVEELTPGTLAHFDLMFATNRAPWCAHHF